METIDRVNHTIQRASSSLYATRSPSNSQFREPVSRTTCKKFLTYCSNLDSFDNTDPRILTVLVIGTEEKVQNYLWLQQRNGYAAVGDWSRLLPVPNCPAKVMSILNKTVT